MWIRICLPWTMWKVKRNLWAAKQRKGEREIYWKLCKRKQQPFSILCIAFSIYTKWITINQCVCICCSVFGSRFICANLRSFIHQRWERKLVFLPGTRFINWTIFIESSASEINQLKCLSLWAQWHQIAFDFAIEISVLPIICNLEMIWFSVCWVNKNREKCHRHS